MGNVNYRHKMHFEKSYLKICCFQSLGALFLTLSPPSGKNWFLCLFRITFLFFKFLSPNLFHLTLFCLSLNSFIQICSLFSLYYKIFMFWMKTQTIEIFPFFYQALLSLQEFKCFPNDETAHSSCLMPLPSVCSSLTPQGAPTLNILVII